MLRFATDQAGLEADILAELAAARPHRLCDLAAAVTQGGTDPSPRQRRLIAYARKALAKCDMQPKHVMSAMVNVRHPLSRSLMA